MIAVVQRVKSSVVTVDGNEIGKAKSGLLVLLCVVNGDTEKEAELLANKVANLRIFSDRNDKMNLSALDVGGEILSISNFTLSADTKKGNRPSFFDSMNPEESNRLYNYFNKKLSDTGIISVETGEFGAYMQISANLDGPITIILNTDVWTKK